MLGFDYDNSGWLGGGIYEFTGADVIGTTGGGAGGGGGFQLPEITIGVGGGGGGGGTGAPSVAQNLTQIVNNFEYQLKANLGLFQSGAKSKDAALATGWQLMDAMVAACLPYGAAGQKSAAERDRRINPPSLRWDWIAYYIDPITGGNTVLPPVPGGGLNTTYGAGGQTNGVWLLVGLVVILFFWKD